MSTKFKTGDKVRVMHSFMNKQGKKGKLVVINEEENNGLVKFKDGSEYWYSLSNLERVKKKLKIKDFHIGRCYKLGSTCLKIDGVDSFGDFYGTMVTGFNNHSEIWCNTDLFNHPQDKKRFKEITREEFEKKLKAAKREMTRIYKQLKSESDEKANTKGTEMA